MKIKNWQILALIAAGAVVVILIWQWRTIFDLKMQLSDCGDRERGCGSRVEDLSSKNQLLVAENKFLQQENEINEKLLDEEHKVDNPKKHNEMGYLRDRSQDKA